MNSNLKNNTDFNLCFLFFKLSEYYLIETILKLKIQKTLNKIEYE